MNSVTGCACCLPYSCVPSWVWRDGLPSSRLCWPEQLNVDRKHELVTYPFTAENGACVADSLRLSGPNGAVPVQLANIACWPETTFVKSATLAFVVDALAPRTTNTYQLTFGPAAVQDAVPVPDLTVSVNEARLEATTSRFGVRLLLGTKTFDPPLPAKDVPAPVLAMRRTNGDWFGGSRLYGETAIAGFTTTVIDRGPAYVRVAYRYTYADGNTLDFTAQLNAQGNQVFFETASARDNRKDGLDLLLTPGLPALVLQYMPEQVNKQSNTSAIGTSGWKQRAVADYPAGMITNLIPWGDWTNEYTQTKFYLRYADMPEELVITRQDAGGLGEAG